MLVLLSTAKFERRLIPARKFDFDTTVGAIGSNEPKWSCNDVILMFERPGECDQKEVDAFMEFFEPPFGTLEKCVPHLCFGQDIFFELHFK